MNCPVCGLNMPDDLRYCPSCGTPVQKPVINPVQPAMNAVQPVKKNKSSLPVILGCVGGGIVLLILVVLLFAIISGDVSELDNVNWDNDSENVTMAAEPQEQKINWVAEPFFEADNVQCVLFYDGDYIDSRYSLFYKDGKYGVIDETGNIVCNAVYDTPGYCEVCNGITFSYEEQLFSFETDSLIYHGGHGGGFSDFYYDLNSGAYMCVIGGEGPSYEIEYDVTGCYVVKECTKSVNYHDPRTGETYYDYVETGRYGLYYNGNLVVPLEYTNALGISDGVVAFYDGASWTYFSYDGTVILKNVATNGDTITWWTASPGAEYLDTENTAEVVYEFRCGSVPVKKDGKWGYMDKNGNMIIDAVFDKALPAYQNNAWVCVDGMWGIISVR